MSVNERKRESILRYGLIMWGNSSDRNRLFVAEKKCIRAILWNFTGWNIPTLVSFYIYQICIVMWKHTFLFEIVVNSRVGRDPNRIELDNIPMFENKQ